MLTEEWFQLRPHRLQSMLWRTKARFCAVAAGRGSGKTEISRRKLVCYLRVKKPHPNPMYFFAAPTRDQAAKLGWEPLKKLVPPDWIANISESKFIIYTIFGSSLHVVGMDKPARIEGVQWDGGVVDESCDIKPKAFDLSIMPALTHRNGWCIRQGVPKRAGCGAREFKEYFDKGSPPGTPGAELESYTWPSSDILTDAQLRFAQESMDARDFAEQFGASWQSVGGLVFHAYSDTLNVREVMYRPELPLLVMSDFNTSPMAWVIGQSKDITLSPNPPGKISELWVIDELFIRNTNTLATLSDLHKRYSTHKGGWMFFGDATGRARKTSASDSDYAHIRNSTLFPGARVFYLKSNPPRMNRFSSTNAGFCSAIGERRIMIHPRCKELRKDLLTRAFKEGSNEPDDYGEVGHITDALGYGAFKFWPPIIDPGSYVPNVGFAQ